MRIGLDIHGTIDKKPKFFAVFTQRAIANGHFVYVITGSQKTKELELQLKDWGIQYTHFFSIADSLIAEGVIVHWKDKDNPWFDECYWIDAKAKYCARQGIDLMIDDSETYGKYFTTLYAKVI